LFEEIAAAVKNGAEAFLDAPVTGSKPAAIEGTLVFMVGGSAEVIEEHRDIFDSWQKAAAHGRLTAAVQ
jgi:3-hydroxyisobutyrate dehydrogenase-like beta-hydroxyacid dehydrogenase